MNEIQTTRTCFLCNKETTDKMYRWYHADQDDLICKDCAKKTKHNDTDFRGLSVFDKSSAE